MIDTSQAALRSLDVRAMELRVLAAVQTFGSEGCTQDQVLQMPRFSDTPYSSVTARFRALLDSEEIVDTGERRKGRSGRNQRVIRATRFD